MPSLGAVILNESLCSLVVCFCVFYCPLILYLVKPATKHATRSSDSGGNIDVFKYLGQKLYWHLILVDV